MIVVALTTDGRRDCLEATVESIAADLLGPVTERVMHDDSGDPAHRLWLRERFPDWRHVGDGPRRGFGGSQRALRSWLQENTHEPLIAWWEDDFTLERRVDLAGMASVLRHRPELAQLVLLRQPWNDAERAAGGIHQMWPAEYVEMTVAGHHWLEHRLFWSTNPSLFRRSLLEVEWPTGDRSERAFSDLLLRDGFDGVPGGDVRFAYWGARGDPPAVWHIGDQRAGNGY